MRLLRIATLAPPLVTAFTVAQSITLGLTTLGFVHVPSKPVEAVIALRNVFVAAQIVHARRGRTRLAGTDTPDSFARKSTNG
jgi:hypothetical protein